MARTIGVMNECYTDEELNAVIRFCVTVIPGAGDTFATQTHNLEYRPQPGQTPTQINNGIQDQAILEMAKLGITVSRADFLQTKFS